MPFSVMSNKIFAVNSTMPNVIANDCANYHLKKKKACILHQKVYFMYVTMYCAKNPPIYDNRLDLTTEQSMMMYVAEIGQVERGRQCHLMLDHQNKRKKSFALLYYILHARDQYNPSSAMMENAKNHGRTKNTNKFFGDLQAL